MLRTMSDIGVIGGEMFSIPAVHILSSLLLCMFLFPDYVQLATHHHISDPLQSSSSLQYMDS